LLNSAWNRRASIGVVGGYNGRRELCWERSYIGRGDLGDMSVLAAVRAVGVEAYLGRDQGGEGAALDEAHLDGWDSISINCTVSAGGLGVGRVLGRARRWGSCGWRSTVMVVVMAAASFCERDLPLGAVPRRASTTTSPPPATTPAATTAMSALHRSIGSRLLAPALRPATARSFAPAYRTYSTNEDVPHQHKTTSEDAPAVPLKSESTQIRKETASQGTPHAPDYNVAIDYRTSCVAPNDSQSTAS
jgi:hypothetical protein